MKIAAVVVTYNRKEKLIINLQHLITQTRPLDRIYIIDNCSTDRTFEFVKDYISNEKNNVAYIRLEENLGGSGGFSYGIKKAYQDGFDFIWGMDDDAYPELDALQKLISSYKNINQISCLWSNCNNDKEFEGPIKKVTNWMFVGFFIPKQIIERVGFPRDDFFIYHDDTEYSYRIIKNGFNIYKVKDSLIIHQDTISQNYIDVNFIGRTIHIFKLPKQDWKFYYYVRNYLLKFSYKDINKYKVIFVKMPVIFVKTILMEPKKLFLFVKAFYHGICDKSGINMKP